MSLVSHAAAEEASQTLGNRKTNGVSNSTPIGTQDAFRCVTTARCAWTDGTQTSASRAARTPPDLLLSSRRRDVRPGGVACTVGARFARRQPEMFQDRHDRASVGDRRNPPQKIAAPRTGGGRQSPTRGEAASPSRSDGLGVLHARDARRERPRRPPRLAPGPARSRRRVRRDTRAHGRPLARNAPRRGGAATVAPERRPLATASSAQTPRGIASTGDAAAGRALPPGASRLLAISSGCERPTRCASTPRLRFVSAAPLPDDPSVVSATVAREFSHELDAINPWVAQLELPTQDRAKNFVAMFVPSLRNPCTERVI